MTHRATFSLDERAFKFLKSEAGSNRSAFVSRLLREEEQRQLAQEILRANDEEREDLAYQEELADWDVTVDDGLT